MLSRWMCICGLFVAMAPRAAAQQDKNPLRFVPSQAEWVVQVDRPSEIVEAVEKNPLFQQAQQLAGVREFYDSTNVQRFYQLVAYVEKKLDRNKDALLDELTAGGLVFAARLSKPQGALLVVQAKNEKMLHRFMDVALELLEKEVERQESKERVVRTKYRSHELARIGSNLNFVLADGALLVASDEATLKSALDTQSGKEPTGVLAHPSFAEARRAAPGKSLAWTWLHLEELRKIAEFKNGLDAASLDPGQNLLFGGLVNLLKRSPYVTGALTRGEDGYRLGIAMPRGREGMGVLAHMILPTDGRGTLPPLEPARTLVSSSYFLDLGQFWDKRVEIVGKKNAEGLEEGDKNLAKFLGGIKLGKLFHAAGTHHRVIVAQQKEKPYKIKPAKPFPAFALVVDMRDPTFAKDMNSIFRSAALFATFTIGLQLKEDNYKDCDIVSYYFSETKKVANDPDGVRFNFNPSYVTVGDQFVMSATAELARDLVDVLKAEQKEKPTQATMRTVLRAAGLTDIIRANQEGFLTKLILREALPPKTAAQEMQTILDWIEQFGVLRLEANYGANDFRYDIVWQQRKR